MNTAARTEVRGARSLNDTAPRAQEFSNDDLLKLLVAIRGSSIPDSARTALRDLVLEYSQIDDAEEKSAFGARLRNAIEPYQRELGPALGMQAAPAAAPQSEHRTAGSLGRTRRTASFREETVRRIPVTPAQPAPQRKEPAPIPQPEAQAPEPAPAQQAVHEKVADPKARIAEIKRAVNEKVGNPVNLIEQDRAVGQEYMAALLDAIKRSAAGGAGVEDAMARLERAYDAALQLLQNGPKKEETPKQEPKPTPAPQKAEPPPAPEHTAPRKPAPEATEAPKSPPPAEPMPRADRPRPSALSSLASIERRPAPVRTKPAAVQTTPEPQPTHAGSEPKADDTFSVRALRAQKPAKGAPEQLNTPEIDAGLAQLLSEWKLFKRSGFLGTGPSGIEHPLYKKLQALPMAAVVSGRFEGATPEIRQTIADYMNGWRYEQGIVHKMEEQFEVYLRRVIRHILKAQKQQTEPPNAR